MARAAGHPDGSSCARGRGRLGAAWGVSDAALAAGIVASEITRPGALDLDGDGTEDEVLAIARDEGAPRGNVVVRHTATGYRALYLGHDADSEMTSSAMHAPVAAAPVGYVLYSSGSVDLAAGVDTSAYALCRMRGDQCVPVFVAETAFGSAEAWTFRDAGTGDGALRVTDDCGASQVLRWDAQAFRLVPGASEGVRVQTDAGGTLR